MGIGNSDSSGVGLSVASLTEASGEGWGLSEIIGIGVGDGSGAGELLTVAIGEGAGLTVKVDSIIVGGVGVGVKLDELIDAGKVSESYPLLLAITSQSNFPLLKPFNSRTTNPYGVLSNTYNCPRIVLVVGVTITLIGAVSEINAANE